MVNGLTVVSQMMSVSLRGEMTMPVEGGQNVELAIIENMSAALSLCTSKVISQNIYILKYQ